MLKERVIEYITKNLEINRTITCSKITKDLGTSTMYTNKLIQSLEEEGTIKRNKVGNKKVIYDISI